MEKRYMATSPKFQAGKNFLLRHDTQIHPPSTSGAALFHGQGEPFTVLSQTHGIPLSAHSEGVKLARLYHLAMQLTGEFIQKPKLFSNFVEETPLSWPLESTGYDMMFGDANKTKEFKSNQWGQKLKDEVILLITET